MWSSCFKSIYWKLFNNKFVFFIDETISCFPNSLALKRILALLMMLLILCIIFIRVLMRTPNLVLWSNFFLFNYSFKQIMTLWFPWYCLLNVILLYIKRYQFVHINDTKCRSPWSFTIFVLYK